MSVSEPLHSLKRDVDASDWPCIPKIVLVDRALFFLLTERAAATCEHDNPNSSNPAIDQKPRAFGCLFLYSIFYHDM